jgi:hypothetical protein
MVAEVAWRGWQGGIDTDVHRTAGVSVAFSPELPARNLHTAETNGNGVWWRWTGPASRSSFAMPVPGPGQWNLKFHVMNWGVVRQASDLKIYASGQSLPLRWADDNSAAFGPFTVPISEASGVTRVDVVTPLTRRASPDDDRQIGINLIQCVLEGAG